MNSEEKQTQEDKIDVAAALVVRKDGRILTVFNEQWGGFTLPMTKRRIRSDEKTLWTHEESWEDAAARAAVEVLGAPCFVSPVKIPIKPTPMISRRDGRVKRYNYRVFRVTFDSSGPSPIPGRDCVLAWLTPGQITAPPGKGLRPISSSAYLLVYRIRIHAPQVLKSGIAIGD